MSICSGYTGPDAYSHVNENIYTSSAGNFANKRMWFQTFFGRLSSFPYVGKILPHLEY